MSPQRFGIIAHFFGFPVQRACVAQCGYIFPPVTPQQKALLLPHLEQVWT